ncbi:MAG: protein kinase [Deltaproteobacteria bacterium]|nr:protein kinase [Deltaproteobacteria bacterium]
MMTRTVATELMTGRMVGPYRLLFRLGKGGMGEVWAAQRGGQFGFERLVALKLLRGAPRDSNAAVMFFDEARAAAALQHAAIVPTFDLGQYGETFYIAMGMVRGPSLTALLQRLAVQKTPLTPAMVAYVGERLANALDYAYERAEVDGKKLRLIHRDISPHNVLIDDSGNVMLSDFGVARTSVQDHESRVGTVRGKPSYMAPEQVTGGAIDARTDIFALGIVLYECACVKRLFGRSNPVKSMEAVLHYAPKPLTQLIPGFPEPLWAVIEKSLAKEPNDRYQSAADFGRALNEAARELDNSVTASRDLTVMIAEHFAAGSFDVDARVKEALVQAQAAMGEAAGEVMEATTYEPRPRTGSSSQPEQPALPALSPQAEAAFAEALGTGAAWPAAMYTADPLAPDALAEVQAQIAAVPPNGFTPTNSSPSFQSYSQVSASSHAPVPRSRTLAMAIGAAAAAAIAVGAVVIVNKGRSEPIPVPARSATPGPGEPFAGVGVVPGPQEPEATPTAPKSPDPREATEPAPATPAREVRKEKARPLVQPRPPEAAIEPPDAKKVKLPALCDTDLGKCIAELKKSGQLDQGSANLMTLKLAEGAPADAVRKQLLGLLQKP